MIRTRHFRRFFMAVVCGLLVLATLPVLPVAARRPVGVVARTVIVSVAHSRIVDLQPSATHVALHWPGNRDARLTLSFSSDGATFGVPTAVELDEDGAHGSTETYAGLVPTDGARFVRVTSNRPLPRLAVVAIDARAHTKTVAVDPYAAAAAVDQPQVISRAGWGADESLRFTSSGTEVWPPEFHPIQKLIVHHTAGKNNDPDPEATVRAIYYYDAVTKGWGDMGYNFLIDEAGHIYEGRYSREYASNEIPTGEDVAGNGVTGAHVGGWNSGTVGIALLGTLSNQDAAPAARAALEQLLAWKAERHAIDPLASSTYVNPVSGSTKFVANISGHRDWAATLCPGDAFYSTLPALRQAVESRINPTSAATVPGAPALTASTPSSGKGVSLSWNAPGDDGGSPLTAYRVLRLKNGSFSRIATVSGTTLTYRDTKTKRGVSYTYVVRAVNAVGAGPDSNEASAKAR